ncbi:MAG: hypothetical protein E5V62_07605 [Mesorhizobium sp.]|uniref:hypothetical protein n=1 Tax=Mesorhizobium sp. TaxID=1871066 RepID=UPI000FD5D7B8|nr:hypothetical protein [Mesorhizobium sp.]RVD73340.1 hypothetical protein EN751_05370 [Mesorhizobium sp. M4A.F.Ca.ET.029.04.2.1]TIW36213.1 MAG: hypothetical protein E5V62_07605 [Mesorhizobium sp.]
MKAVLSQFCILRTGGFGVATSFLPLYISQILFDETEYGSDRDSGEIDRYADDASGVVDRHPQGAENRTDRS